MRRSPLRKRLRVGSVVNPNLTVKPDPNKNNCAEFNKNESPANHTRSKTKYLNNEEYHYKNKLNQNNGKIDNDYSEVNNNEILWNGIPVPYILKNTEKNEWKLLEFDDDEVFNSADDDNLYKFLNRGAEGMAYVNSTQTKIVKIITDTTYGNKDRIKNEIDLQIIAAKKNCAPEIYEKELQNGTVYNPGNKFPADFLFFTMKYLNPYEWKGPIGPSTNNKTLNAKLILEFVLKLVYETEIYNDVDPRFHIFKYIYMGQNRIRMIDYGRCKNINKNFEIYSYYDSYLKEKLGDLNWNNIKKDKPKVAATLSMLCALDYPFQTGNKTNILDAIKYHIYNLYELSTNQKKITKGTLEEKTIKAVKDDFGIMIAEGGKNTNIIENDYRLPLISSSILVLSSVFMNLLKN